MNEHTPTPWHCGLPGAFSINAANGHGIAEVLCYSDDPGFDNKELTIHPKANAAFIVRACNAHDELLAACERAAKSTHHPACRASARQHGCGILSRCTCHVGKAHRAIAKTKPGS